MGFISELKEFAAKGNAVDMAVGILVGGAFTKIVNSIVSDLLMPPLGMAIGGVDFKDLKIVLKAAEGAAPEVAILWGKFVNNLIEFGIIVLAAFVVVKLMNKIISMRAVVNIPGLDEVMEDVGEQDFWRHDAVQHRLARPRFLHGRNAMNLPRLLPRLLLVVPLLALAACATPLGTRTAEAVSIVRGFQASKHPIPPAVFENAKGVAVLREGSGGLVLGGSGGEGVFVKRTGMSWSAPVAINTAGASVGLQAGAQSRDIVIVMNTDDEVRRFLSQGVFGVAEAAAVLGPARVPAATPADRRLRRTTTFGAAASSAACSSAA